MKTAVIHARIDPQTKQRAEGVLHDLGMTSTEVIRILYRQICLRGGLPFPIEVPNERTSSILAKSRVGEEVEMFDSLDDMFESWEK